MAGWRQVKSQVKFGRLVNDGNSSNNVATLQQRPPNKNNSNKINKKKDNNWTWLQLQLQLECVSTLKCVMDSRIGLDYIVENREYVAKLASALDTANTTVKKQVFELLSALCVYNADGYHRTLDALEHYKSLKGEA